MLTQWIFMVGYFFWTPQKHVIVVTEPLLGNPKWHGLKRPFRLSTGNKITTPQNPGHPPGIPCTFHSFGVVCSSHCTAHVLLLAMRCWKKFFFHGFGFGLVLFILSSAKLTQKAGVSVEPNMCDGQKVSKTFEGNSRDWYSHDIRIFVRMQKHATNTWPRRVWNRSILCSPKEHLWLPLMVQSHTLSLSLSKKYVVWNIKWIFVHPRMWIMVWK